MPTIADYLKYANLQMAAEAFIRNEITNILADSGQPLIDALISGNGHASRFTEHNKRGQAQFHPFSCSALTPPPNRSCTDAGPTVTLPFGRPRGLASRRSPSAKAISA